MKKICAILISFVGLNTYAATDQLNCLRSNYIDYTKKVDRYWKVKDSEFKRLYPDLHSEFSYLNTEQKNHNRMQEITINYLIKNNPDELKLDGSLYNLVPRYKYYAQDIYRELRANPEFNQLYIDIESYKKENKMPNYERLKKASSRLQEIDSLPAVKSSMDQAVEASQLMVPTLPCSS